MPLRPDLAFTCSTVIIECLESSPPSMAASFVVPLRAPEIGTKVLFECSRRFETPKVRRFPPIVESSSDVDRRRLSCRGVE